MQFEVPRPPSHPKRQLLAIGLAVGLTVPALGLRLSGTHPESWIAAVVFGLAVVGAAFLLAWARRGPPAGCLGRPGARRPRPDRGPARVRGRLRLHLEGRQATRSKYAPLALANMTGGNRLLIGIGWSLVVLLAAWRMKSDRRAPGLRRARSTPRCRLDRDHCGRDRLPARRHHLLADPAPEAHAHAVRLGRPHRPLRRLPHAHRPRARRRARTSSGRPS